ncbi:hypothetical protein PGUG_02706 [Meyerozyma guilliermondii ATCC 6260]|uniref:Zn(2)-C6 fungal-type domain-containing protein n=1 Tax=Meyerozyma guilliermondii (strain ATCC 6260 / CBS 566 / DSM 6381 / JCM 1539 / NBRC 10279 / NRRL Y-324) TaxID=294746 RepID=A5DHF5_PICGU|nr:uncharacterized protein PGUG_02706 [Meyerozyma guilliermondii ATCC 6260]EDK38608.2 hypothetical protein PGUG_02706 [Meyerozyma guilliermondii ATCC 6260]
MSSAPKKKVTKSRNGCITCKKRRIKCDETKPRCNNCVQKAIDCGGYATNFKWRSLNEKGNVKSEDEKSFLYKHLELASLQVTGKTIHDIKAEHDMIALGVNPRRGSQSPYVSDSNASESSKPSLKRSYSQSKVEESHNVPRMKNHPRSLSTNNADNVASISNFRKTAMERDRNDGLQSLVEVAVDEINMRSSPSLPSRELYHIQQRSPSAPSPNLNQVPFSPSLPSYSNKDVNSRGLVTRSPIERSENDFNINLTPSLSALINNAFRSGFEQDFADSSGKPPEIPLSPLNLNTDFRISSPDDSLYSGKQSHPTITFSPAPDNKIMNMSDPESPRNDLSSTEGNNLSSVSASPHQPSSLLRSSDQTQILFLYSEYTCTIMSIKNGPNENPWRNLIVPLATTYPCLFNSIASMTMFHLAGNQRDADASTTLRSRGFSYMKRCVLELASGLSKMNDEGMENTPELPADVALTACLNLAVSETWDTHIFSGIAHLKGAKSMIQKVLTLLKTQRNIVARDRKTLAGPLEVSKLIESKKKDLKKKLVMVDDDEWDDILNDKTPDMSGTLGISIPRSLQFLFNIWIYFEVLAQMTSYSNQDDKGLDLVATITDMLQESHRKKSKIMSIDGDTESVSMKSDSSQSSKGGPVEGSVASFDFFDNLESFGFYAEEVDPLLGCAQSLFSIIGKVANLISKVRKLQMRNGFRNGLSVITQATQLKQELVEWRPVISDNMVARSMVNDGEATGVKSTWDIASCIATAEAYRFASILYLHQAVPEIPCLTSHELAEKVFILLASIPTTSHTYTVHIFPLLVASCEALPGEERDWCVSRWALLSEKLWIGNVERALEVVKEVWKRKDAMTESKSTEVRVHGDGKVKNFTKHISGLMAAINDDQASDNHGRINGKSHWSTIMREWGWEVMLG